jgi:hypothetical protein
VAAAALPTPDPAAAVPPTSAILPNSFNTNAGAASLSQFRHPRFNPPRDSRLRYLFVGCNIYHRPTFEKALYQNLLRLLIKLAQSFINIP